MKRTLGFSMIEILITLLLVTIGVLGMVAMQSRTIQYTQDSAQRNAAAALANDLLELIRAQPTGLPASSEFYKPKTAAFPSLPSSCATTSQTATEQLACWADKAKRLLPGVTTSLLTSDFYICRSKVPGTCSATATGSAVEIQLVWTVKAGQCMDSNNSDDSTSTTCYYRLRSDI